MIRGLIIFIIVWAAIYVAVCIGIDKDERSLQTQIDRREAYSGIQQ